MEKIRKEEAKKRMKCSIFNYVSQNEAIEALISQDSVKLAKIKSLCDRLKIVDEKLISDIDAADEKEFERLVGSFTHPKEAIE